MIIIIKECVEFKVFIVGFFFDLVYDNQLLCSMIVEVFCIVLVLLDVDQLVLEKILKGLVG